LQTVLRTRGAQRGNDASLVLAHQLIATKLNIANGTDSATIAATVADADRLLAMFVGKLPYAVRRSSVLGRSIVGDAALPETYNNDRQTPPCLRIRPSAMRERRGQRSDHR